MTHFFLFFLSNLLKRNKKCLSCLTLKQYKEFLRSSHLSRNLFSTAWTFEKNLTRPSKQCHAAQHKDTQHYDAQHNDTQHYDAQH